MFSLEMRKTIQSPRDIISNKNQEKVRFARKKSRTKITPTKIRHATNYYQFIKNKYLIIVRIRLSVNRYPIFKSQRIFSGYFFKNSIKI